MTRAVRIIVCRVGCTPVVAMLPPDADGAHLAAMQAIVGGRFVLVQLKGGRLNLWCNGDLNGDLVEISDDLTRPGKMGEWGIHGDFFITRSWDSELASVTDADVATWTARWPTSHREVPLDPRQQDRMPRRDCDGQALAATSAAD